VLTGDLRARASIVVPAFNQVFFTRACLTSLRCAQGGAEVIVVDNGSSDGTPELLASWIGAETGLSVLRLAENRGFAAACNAGAEQSSREFLVFLNNDTFVLEDWLANLLRPFGDSEVVVTGSRLLYPDGRVQHAGLAFDATGPQHLFLGLPGDAPIVLRPRQLQAVTGASLAIRRENFQSLGGFDAGYHNSFEDVDLCLRVRAAGGRIVYAPDSVAYHFEGMTEGRHAPIDVRNSERFLQRWRGRYDEDLESLQGEARLGGLDPGQVTGRRQAIDRERRLEAEVAELRMLLDLRSVRLALLGQRLLRSLLPARR
jgi:GT2 family glycosyltransferase